MAKLANQSAKFGWLKKQVDLQGFSKPETGDLTGERLGRGSYREICQITGWTYTNVNRSVAEGRVALRGSAEIAGE